VIFLPETRKEALIYGFPGGTIKEAESLIHAFPARGWERENSEKICDYFMN
jgi:hypothetical protein